MTAAGAIAAKAAEFGAAKVYVADGPEFTDQLVVPKVDALTQIARAVDAAAVLVTSSGEGKEVAARVALRLGSGIITDAVDLEAGGRPGGDAVGVRGVVPGEVAGVARYAGDHGEAELDVAGGGCGGGCGGERGGGVHR